MQVCKLFIKILKKNMFLFLLYLTIFTFISVFMIKGQQPNKEYKEQKIATTIYVEEDSKEVNEFISFLELYIKRVELKNNQTISDALFWDDIDLYLYIPKDFYEKILQGNMGIEIQTSPDSLEATAFLSIVNSYLNTLRESLRLEICSEEKAFSYTTNLFKEKNATHVELTTKESTIGIRGVYDMSIYVLCALILFIVGIVSFELRTTDINRRLRISSYSTTKRNIMLAICFSMVSILFVAIITCIGMILFPNQITTRLLLYIMNSIFFAILVVFMALFLSSLFKSSMAYMCIANAFPLATGFLCGCFIGLELLPNSTKAVAHIFPQLYIVMGNQYIQTATEFYFLEYLKIIWPCFLFIFLFLGGSIFITNRISKSEN